MNDIVTMVASVVFAIGVIALLISRLAPRKRDKWVDTREFEQWKMKISRDCNAQSLQEFQNFLQKYGGGYVRRSHGEIVRQEFLGREKGDLKGIFYQLVVPSKQIPITQKEQFRLFLTEIGVTNVDKRPQYEARDGKLNNKAQDIEERNRKQSGNRGEKIVRDNLEILKKEDYFIVSGVVLQYEGEAKEFDHIVIGENGVFVLETKAFGLSEDILKSSHACLSIAGQDEWTLKKNGQSRILKSPTEQVLAQREFMERFVEEFMTDVRNVLILGNPDLQLQKRIDLDYDVIQVQNLCRYIRNTEGNLAYNDRLALISKINEHRLN
ncbi:MAG: NERD domain-containing protein [Butyrivibrio sp.]|nr:NERD domain-containing protein [Muribaculum sp.]MCM1551683.1 NERD domain-containing protein [Butyrivibrio sp.]